MILSHVDKDSPVYAIVLEHIKTHQHELCKNAKGNSEVTTKYIHQQAHKHTSVVVFAKDGITRSAKLQGFALVQVHVDFLYIDVLCAKGAGKAIIEYTEGLGISMKKPYIVLSALPGVVNWYRRLGFVHAFKQCTEVSNVHSLALSASRGKFAGTENALQNAKFVKLLQALMKLKLTANKTCKTVNACAIDGFTMTKCLRSIK